MDRLRLVAAAGATLISACMISVATGTPLRAASVATNVRYVELGGIDPALPGDRVTMAERIAAAARSVCEARSINSDPTGLSGCVRKQTASAGRQISRHRAASGQLVESLPVVILGA